MLINGSPINSAVINGTSGSGQYFETLFEFLFSSSPAFGGIPVENIISASMSFTSPVTTPIVLNLFESMGVISSIQSKTIFQLLESIKISESFNSSQNTSQSALAILSLIADATIATSITLNETTVLTDTLLNIVSKIESLSDTVSYSTDITNRLVGNNSIVEILKLISSSINNSQAVSVTDIVTLSITHSLLIELLETIIEQILLSANVIDSKSLLVIADSNLEILDNLNSKAILKELLQSNLIFSIPNDVLSKEYSTFVYTPETSSISTYTNYNFDGCYKFNDKYLFYNSTGLYEFGGDTDDTLDIIAKVLTPAYAFGTSNLKQVPSIYLGISTEDVVYLKVRVDGKAETLYKLNKRTDNLETLKLSIGKGLIGRYFQFELETSAKTFDLESIEFFPIQFQRKL